MNPRSCKTILITFLLCLSTVHIAFAQQLPQPYTPPTASRLRIERLAIDTPIVISPYSAALGTWNVARLRDRAGLLAYTPWVSQPGNTVIVGHVETPNRNPSLFFDLHLLEVGDVISVFDGQADWFYAVTEKFVVPYTDLTPVTRTEDKRLTLITCVYDSFQPDTREHLDRTVIVALPIAAPEPTPIPATEATPAA